MGRQGKSVGHTQPGYKIVTIQCLPGLVTEGDILPSLRARSILVHYCGLS